MAKFTGTFVHVVENVYKFEIEADTEEDARKKIEDDPLEYTTTDEPVDVQGLEVENIEFEGDK